MPSTIPHAAVNTNADPSSMGQADYASRLPLQPGHETSSPQSKECIHVCQDSAPQLTSPDIPGSSESIRGRLRSDRRRRLRTTEAPQEAVLNGKKNQRPASQNSHTPSAGRVAKRDQREAGQGERVQLPFRPECLASFADAAHASSLYEALLDTTMQHIVACSPHLRTVPSRAWYPSGSRPVIQQCGTATVFILPVKIDREFWVCLIIRVRQREISLFDPLYGAEGTETRTMCKDLATRFISNCLPEPLSDWDRGWQIVRSDRNTQKYNANDSGVYCLGVAVHIALDLEVPASLDSQLFRSFFYAVCTNINSLATTAEVSGPSPRNSENGRATIPSETEQEHPPQNTTLQLMDTIPSQWIPRYQNQVPEQMLKKIHEERTRPRPVEELLSQECGEESLRREREVAYSFLDAQVSELQPIQAAVKLLVTLSQAFCALDQQVLATPNQAHHLITRLENMRKEAEDFWTINGKADINDAVDRERAFVESYLNQEGERLKLLERLQLAVAQSQVAAVANHLDGLADAYREHRTGRPTCLQGL